MMQAFANRQAVKHTLTTGKARLACQAWRAVRSAPRTNG
jgi:hypothetical protein